MSLAAFESVLGAEHVRTIDGERVDGVPIIGEVCPGTPEEVASCLRVAAEQAQAVLVCGGLGGVMEAAAVGARDAGGTTRATSIPVRTVPGRVSSTGS